MNLWRTAAGSGAVLGWLLSLLVAVESFLPSRRPLPVSHVRLEHGASTSWSDDAGKYDSLANQGAEEEEEDAFPIDGLTDRFVYQSNLHDTIRSLQYQIPRLLLQSLNDTTAAQVYTKDTQLVVATTANERVIVSAGRDDLVTLSQSVSWAVQTSWRVADTVGLAPATADLCVQSQLALAPDQQSLWVSWQTKLLPLALLQPSSTNQAKTPAWNRLQGWSELSLDPTSARVTTHQVRRVVWNNQSLPSSRAQGLGLVTATGFNLQPQWRSSSSGLWQQLGLPSLVDAFPDATLDNPAQPPLYLLNETAKSQATNLSQGWIPLPPSSSLVHDIPWPGSDDWSRYRDVHQAVRHFVDRIIPSMAQGTVSAKSFAPEARLVTLDQSVLLQTPARLTRWYQSLATWQQTGGQWTLQNATLVSWRDSIQLRISYEWSNTLTGTTATGTDLYTLGILRDDDDDGIRGRVVQVQQEGFALGRAGDDASAPRMVDPVWFMRTLATASETGRGQTPDDVWMAWLQRLGGGSRRTGSSPVVTSKLDSKAVVPPKRSTAAAASVYELMRAFYLEWPKIVQTPKGTDSAGAQLPSPPAAEYLADQVELRGYFRETLIRGRAQYARQWGWTLASLQAALRIGQLVSTRDPQVQVSLTAQGNLQVDVTLFLVARGPSWAFLTPNQLSSNNRDGTSGWPLKLQLKSEYVLDETTARITQHCLLESRVNDQLTPADWVAQWTKRQQPSPQSMWSDTLQWLQRFNDLTRN